jgi:hypothetical protein
VLRLAVRLHWFAMSRVKVEVVAYLRTVLDRPCAEVSPLLGQALISAAELLAMTSQTDVGRRIPARAYTERALAIASDPRDAAVLARALALTWTLNFLERSTEPDIVAQMGSTADQAVALARTTGDVHLVGRVLGLLAPPGAAIDQRRRVHTEALECFTQAGDELLAAAELHSLYGVDLAAGELDSAHARVAAAIAAAERLGDQIFLFGFRSDFCLLLLMEGNYAKAQPLVRQCLLVARRTGMLLDVSQTLFAAACCGTWQGEHVTAAVLHGAADADMRTAQANMAITWTKPEQELEQREKARLRELMGSDRYEQEYLTGTKMSRHQAVQLALGMPTGPAVAQS